MANSTNDPVLLGDTYEPGKELDVAVEDSTDVTALAPGAFGKKEGTINWNNPKSVAVTYDVSKDYGPEGSTNYDSSAAWCLAVFRLAKPITYSRAAKKSVPGLKPVDGVLARKEKPLIITSECMSMTVSGSKDSSAKTLNATLKGETNYLSANSFLPGDWVMAWMHTNVQDRDRIIKALLAGAAANDFNSGLKFVGRVHDIRKNITTQPNGIKTVTYSLVGVGFDELSTMFFYNPALATKESKDDILQFMGQIGLDVSKWLSGLDPNRGQFKDNSEAILTGFLDIVVGKSMTRTLASKVDSPDVKQGDIINQHLERVGSDLQASPQRSAEAPFSYLVPVGVAAALGRTGVDERKGNKFGHQAYGYADILTLLTGVQKYAPKDDEFHHGFVPDLDPNSTLVRMRCPERIKGCYIPIEQSFLNTPLLAIMNQFKNPTINEMYTCLRPGVFGDIMPTVVFRQLPFSSDAIFENVNYPLTRFLSLPRWKIPPHLISSLDLGRSNTTHWNFVHVYGQVSPFKQEYEYDLAAQMVHSPPIADVVDMCRSGVKPYMSTVAESISDVTIPGRSRKWMEAIADWNFGLQYTLNGTVNCKGIQSPITEGDNIEVDGIALHIDSLSHSCGMNGPYKYFNTTLNVTHGVPVDQTGSNVIAPKYPGFVYDESKEESQTGDSGDDISVTGMNPGTSSEVR